MDKKKSVILVAVVAIVLILAGTYLCVSQAKDNSIVGMYNVYEYHQYSMKDGEFIDNHSGDGAYDSEFIEITYCSNGTFEGYCCVPISGEVDPPHYPILGTYDEATGMVQYVSSYSYPQSGLYDWVHGFIKDGTMQLSGITYGDDSDYYGSFEFTFVKQGFTVTPVKYDPIFETGDSYKSFEVIESVNGSEVKSANTASFEVKKAADGLYKMDLKVPGSSTAVTFVGSTVKDGIIMGVGYNNGSAFSLLITDQGDYVQIDREYALGADSATWTAYMTKDGKSVDVKNVPILMMDMYGTMVGKVLGKKEQSAIGNLLVNTLGETTISAYSDFDSKKSYGNVIPSENGYILAISYAQNTSSETLYYLGFGFIPSDLSKLYFSGLYVTSEGDVGALTFCGKGSDKSIVGMYNISEYHQYSMDNGTFIDNHSGDGAYDTEFIEITSYSNGIFEGYCCVPKDGEVNPPRYPILGTYDENTGMIQYTCSYSYPSSGLYDWVHGFIKDGTMQLSGITYGDDSDYYGSFEFTFVKQGFTVTPVKYDPIFNAGDSYKSFKVIETLDDTFVESVDTVSFEVVKASSGLYKMNMTMPGSSTAVNFVGATVADGIIMGIGYEDGSAFSLVITEQGDYIQINRGYSFSDYSATWTAYLTKDGKSVAVKEMPKIDTKFNGKLNSKTIGGDVKTLSGNIDVATYGNVLVGITLKYTVVYGNLIPYGDGYITAVSFTQKISSGTIYYFGFGFIPGDMSKIYYSGLVMSSDSTLSAMCCAGDKA